MKYLNKFILYENLETIFFENEHFKTKSRQ